MADGITTLPNNPGKRHNHPAVPDRGDDWVLTGCRLIPNWDAGTLKISNGELAIADSGTLYWVDVSTRPAIDIPSGQSGVYYDVDVSGLRPTGAITVGSAPAEPMLQIGTVDADAETTDDTLNRDPDDSFGSLETEALKNAVDGDQWETLKLAGYEEGDVISVSPLASPSGSDNTVNTGYTKVSNIGQVKFVWNQITQGNVTFAWSFSGDYTGNVDARVQNVTDSETVVEVLDVNGTLQDGAAEMPDFADYSPTTTNAGLSLELQIRSRDGNEVQVFEPSIWMGVRL